MLWVELKLVKPMPHNPPFLICSEARFKSSDKLDQKVDELIIENMSCEKCEVQEARVPGCVEPLKIRLPDVGSLVDEGAEKRR